VGGIPLLTLRCIGSKARRNRKACPWELPKKKQDAERYVKTARLGGQQKIWQISQIEFLGGILQWI